ncbi:hypothetical protein L291_3667 [Acinetobacter guillouiae MSP4-18]|uniref:hypothetical protein n=1 Tax=Acinetobacter guillouiae TaxID=106649 RepID=UPI0002CDF75F|nr:hypothetical protein [Acinetobacter guillouiae]ENU57595.1 hypothetical protein F981_01881 [Acinetobacter guillouiae CIP 63.46]EPH31270.1 hypothetical protein L291_3667 [Acinetobacter guillouiae MSP4-18]KAB0626713.1 hypothetical protein F7P82_08555 [Acinetobacter guillouiae]
MEFNLDELNSIYWALREDGGYSASLVLKKIEAKYTFCWFCHKLVLNEEIESHQQKELEE